MIKLTCSRLFYSDSIFYADLVIINNSSDVVYIAKIIYNVLAYSWDNIGFGINKIYYGKKEKSYMRPFSNFISESELWELPEIIQKVPVIEIPPGCSGSIDSVFLGDLGWCNFITNKWNPEYFTISYYPFAQFASIPRDSIKASQNIISGITELLYCKMYNKIINSDKIVWMKAP